MRRVSTIRVFNLKEDVSLKSLITLKFLDFETIDNKVQEMFTEFKALNFQTTFFKKLTSLYQEITTFTKTIIDQQTQLVIDVTKYEERLLKRFSFFQSKIKSSDRKKRQALLLDEEDKQDRYYTVLSNLVNNFHSGSVTKQQIDDQYLFLAARTRNQLKIFLTLYNIKYSKSILTTGDKLTLLCRVKKLVALVQEERLGFQTRNRNERIVMRNRELSLLYSSRDRANSEPTSNQIIVTELCHSEDEMLNIQKTMNRLKNERLQLSTLDPNLPLVTDSPQDTTNFDLETSSVDPSINVYDESNLYVQTPKLDVTSPVHSLISKFEANTMQSASPTNFGLITPTRSHSKLTHGGLNTWREKRNSDSDFDFKTDLDAVKAVSETPVIATILAKLYEANDQQLLTHRILALEEFLKDMKRLMEDLFNGSLDIEGHWAIKLINVEQDVIFDLNNIENGLISKYSKPIEMVVLQPYKMCNHNKQCVELQTDSIYLDTQSNIKCSTPPELVQRRPKSSYFCKNYEKEYCRFSKTSNIACSYKTTVYDSNISILNRKIYIKLQGGRVVIEDFFLTDEELYDLISSMYPPQTQIMDIVNGSGWKVYSFFSHIFFVLFLFVRFVIWITKKLRKRFKSYAVQKNLKKEERENEQQQRLLRVLSQGREMQDVPIPHIPRLN